MGRVEKITDIGKGPGKTKAVLGSAKPYFGFERILYRRYSRRRHLAGFLLRSAGTSRTSKIVGNLGYEVSALRTIFLCHFFASAPTINVGTGRKK